MQKENAVKVGAVISAANMKKIQAVHDAVVEMGAECSSAEASKHVKYMLGMGESEAAIEYAKSELSDIISASQVLQQLSVIMYNEIKEPEDRAKITALMRGVVEFIVGEIDEMETSAGESDEPSAAEPAEPEAKNAKIPAQLATSTDAPKLDMSYAKSMGIQLPDDELVKKLAVKFIGRDEILHPVFLWGDIKHMDVEKDFFNRDTDFWDKALGNTPRPLTWDHGQDEEFKAANPVVGRTVEWTDDEMGRWATSVLDRDKAYRKYIDKFIEQKALGSSSDSAPQYVIREKAGKGNWIKQWPWIASALTPMPAEPRMKVFTPEFLKSWNIVLPDAPNESARQTSELQTIQLRERELRLKSKLIIGGQ